jgi:hypothetical protein
VLLADNSNATHSDCSATIFNTEALMDKCKRMRSGPMYFDNATQPHMWPVLQEQCTYALFKHMFFIFLAFASIWCSQHAITERHKIIHDMTRAIQIGAYCVDVLSVVLDMILEYTSDKGVAAGSNTTGIVLFSVCLLLVPMIEYVDTRGVCFVVHKPNPETNAGNEKGGQTQPEVTISEPKREHMHSHIYLSYACLLLFPLVVLFILAHTHAALVDVLIQLVFFSFIFYTTFDVFQARATSVLLCVATPAEDYDHKAKHAQELHVVKFFVVLAFFLCKCFVLLSALVLLQTQYNQTTFQSATLVVHYVVLGGFSIADFLHISFTHLSSGSPSPTFCTFQQTPPVLVSRGRTVMLYIVECNIMEWTMPNESRICRRMLILKKEECCLPVCHSQV